MNARELLNATVIYCLVAAVVVPGGSLVRAMKKKGMLESASSVY